MLCKPENNKNQSTEILTELSFFIIMYLQNSRPFLTRILSYRLKNHTESYCLKDILSHKTLRLWITYHAVIEILMENFIQAIVITPPYPLAKDNVIFRQWKSPSSNNCDSELHWNTYDNKYI